MARPASDPRHTRRASEVVPEGMETIPDSALVAAVANIVPEATEPMPDSALVLVAAVANIVLVAAVANTVPDRTIHRAIRREVLAGLM